MKRILTYLILISKNCFGQTDKVQSVNYAGNTIEISTGYKSSKESTISGNGFRAEWMYLSSIMSIQELKDQLTDQFEKELPLQEIEKITFLSAGNLFSGKKYILNNSSFLILGFGTINKQQLMLNMNFKSEPKSNDDFDDLIKNFIVFKD